jgi:hypothetical protein
MLYTLCLFSIRMEFLTVTIGAPWQVSSEDEDEDED